MSKEKLLDMTEDEQVDWLWDMDILKPNESLADLAFRLRDEAVNHQGWGEAIKDVCDYWQGKNNTGITLSGFWIHRAKPIHWIIAALIALEKS